MKKSIKLVEMAEGIHKELEQLSMQLADKAVTIRKLLNDNTVLNKRLMELEQKRKAEWWDTIIVWEFIEVPLIF